MICSTLRWARQPAGSQVHNPAPTWRASPARTVSRWDTASASAGASWWWAGSSWRAGSRRASLFAALSSAFGQPIRGRIGRTAIERYGRLAQAQRRRCAPAGARGRPWRAPYAPARPSASAERRRTRLFQDYDLQRGSVRSAPGSVRLRARSRSGASGWPGSSWVRACSRGPAADISGPLVLRRRPGRRPTRASPTCSSWRSTRPATRRCSCSCARACERPARACGSTALIGGLAVAARRRRARLRADRRQRRQRRPAPRSR